MSVRNKSVQSCWNFMGIILLCVFLAFVPVSANYTIAPDISPGATDHIGAPGPNLAADALAMTANKDSVSRGGSRFSVTIVGSPRTLYYLWIKNTSAMTGEPQDQPPAIMVSEPVYQDPMGGPFLIGSHPVLGGGGRTILDDIPPATANISNTEYYAAILTNSRGYATVEWNAYLTTKPGPYTIHVEGDTVSADTILSVDSAINNQYSPITGFFARPEYVILHPEVNTIGETSTDEGLITINRSATVFIGEEGLNVAPALSSAQALSGSTSTIIGWWASPDDALTSHSTVDVDITGREHNFLVSQAEFDGYEGNWYLVDPVTGFSCSNAGSPVLVVTVRAPHLDISIWDLDAGRDVSGKAIPLGENLTFRVDTNLVLALDKVSRPDISSNTQGIITIKVKDEIGAVLNYLYRDNSTIQTLTNLSVNTSPWFWGGGTTPGRNYWATYLLDRDHYYYYPQGTYVISAESSLNNMKENYLSGSAAYTGRTVSETETVTLVSDIVQISTNSDSVVRGYPFAVHVQGRPLATYHLWIENTSTMMGTYGDQPPVIAPGQAGVSQDCDPGLTHRAPVFPEAGAYQFEGGGGKAIYQDVAPGWPGSISPLLKNGTTEYANITLSINGYIDIQFLTTNDTKPQTYSIRVEQVFPVASSAEMGAVKRDSIEVTVEGPLPTPTITPDPGHSSTDSDTPSDSGMVGQTVASSPGAGAGQTMTFSFSQSGGTVIISQVHLVPVSQIGSLDLIAQPVSPGQTLPVPALAVAGYEQITPVGLNPSAIDHGTITFGVTGTWLTGNNAAREDIVLMRYHDMQWDALPTRFDHQAGDIFYFIADTPGFSYFAVAVKPTGSPVVNTSITTVVTPRLPAIALGTIPHTPALLRAPAQSLPEVSQITVVPPASHERSPGILYSVVVCGVAACLVLVSGVIIVRRWWIRRQNPALFFGR